jgi:transcriptional regulator with XRE-family HTH domain
VDTNYDGRGFHSFGVLSLLKQEIENMQVMSLTCRADVWPKIEIDTHVKAEIVAKGLGTSDYDADRKMRWFTVHLSGVLHHGLHDVISDGVEEYYNGKFDKENTLDAYLLPYISTDQLEDIADDFTKFCAGEEVYNGWDSPLQKILNELELTWYESELTAGEMGRMYFREREEEVVESVSQPGKRLPKFELVKRKIEPGTMLISREHYFINGYGSRADTIAHEVVHWDKHDKFFEILALLNGEEKTLYCESDPVRSPDGLEGVAKARWWAEWQANSLAPRYLMPRWIFKKFFNDVIEDQREVYGGTEAEVLERAINQMSGVFGVSPYEVKLRALQLGYKQAEGTFLRVNRQRHSPYTFNPNALGEYETFLLDSRNGKRIYEENPEFARLIDSGDFVYTGCVVCINDPLYVQPTDDPSCPQGVDLTDYALTHVDLCCLKFKRVYSHVDATDEYYNLCYLSKDINAAEFKETKKIELSSNQDPIEEMRQLKLLKAENKRVTAIKRKLPTNFAETLSVHMDRLKDEYGKKMTFKCLHERTGLSEKYLSNVINGGKKPSIEVLYAICLAMHLHPILSEDVITKAYGGYPDDEEGAMAEYILGHHYMESIDLVNERLQKMEYPIWGKSVEK